MRTDRVSNRAGFVLLEAVVALMIVSLVAIALLETSGSQIRTASKGTALMVARSLAEDRLALIRLLNNESMQDLPDSLAQGTFEAPYGEFTWTASVTEVEEERDLYDVIVTVEGLGESLPLRTLIHSARPTLQRVEEDVPAGGTPNTPRPVPPRPPPPPLR